MIHLRNRLSIMVLGAAVAVSSLEAHITPEVIVRKQADVIRSAIPGAAKYKVTTVDISRQQLQQIVERGHYTPNSASVKMYSGEDASGHLIGTVLFPQIDSQHGPIEVGVAISPDGAVSSVAVTRLTVEMKPWLLDVEQSNILDRLKGLRAGDQIPPLANAGMAAMPGYVANLIATATMRALTLQQVLSLSQRP